jgi:hypothetical protein
LKWGERFAKQTNCVNRFDVAEKKLTEKENMDSIDEWENCKGQCGHTRFCRQCMQERNTLVRQKKQAERKRMEELYDARLKDYGSG